METNRFHNLDEVLLYSISSILDNGSPISTRNLETKEIFPFSFVLENPRNRCLANPSRRWNLPLALGELSWHFTGDNSVDALTYYAKQWSNFATDSKVLESCYGKKIFEGGNSSQWNRVFSLLSRDRESRRAVLSFYDPNNGLDPNLKDVACTCTIQFLIRENRLNAITYMRSNDVIWGLPYDVFFFTMLQEILAYKLGVEVGDYYHFVGSLHLYKRHFGLAEKVRDSRFNGYFEMEPLTDLELMDVFLDAESQIRTGEALETFKKSNSNYWNSLTDVLISHRLLREERNEEALGLLSKNPYKEFMI
ncbi:MAG: thymidylate synthase [Imperialibacter sp.]|uniref:thymidylate synthase n=1 Tax=Imperialibacter sp. TaxID=2038411 RepID=UPI0032ED02AB